MAYDIGLDLGSTAIKTYVEGKGVTYHEPSVIAYHTKENKVLAVGSLAYQMLGKAPSYIKVAYPIINGGISDYDLNAKLLDAVLKNAGDSAFMKPRVSLCVHPGQSGVQRQTLLDAAIQMGARKVYLLEKPIAAAVGAGLDIRIARGRLVVHLGGGTTDVAVISLNGIVRSASVAVGGRTLSQEIIRHCMHKYKLVIGELTAETIKKEKINIYAPPKNKKIAVRGRDVQTGLPFEIMIPEGELYEVLKDTVQKIYTVVHNVLENTPPELVSDIYEDGMILTGGGAQLSGMKEFLAEKLKISAMIAENPETCAVIGAGRSLMHIDEFYGGLAVN